MCYLLLEITKMASSKTAKERYTSAKNPGVSAYPHNVNFTSVPLEAATAA